MRFQCLLQEGTHAQNISSDNRDLIRVFSSYFHRLPVFVQHAHYNDHGPLVLVSVYVHFYQVFYELPVYLFTIRSVE